MTPKDHIIMKLLRLVTPEEINHLINSSPSTNRSPLTDIIVSYLAGNDGEGKGAKILPLNEDIENEKSSSFEHVVSYLKAGVQTEKTIDGFTKKNGHKLMLDETSKEPAASLIMLEKQRFKKMQTKLKEKEVLNSYIKNAQIDIDVEKQNKDDLAKAGMVGVLINKKQF